MDKGLQAFAHHQLAQAALQAQLHRLLRGLHRLHFRLAAANARNAGADAVSARFHRLRHIQRACRIAARRDHGLADEFSAAVVKTIDHARRLLIRQAQLNGQWPIRCLTIRVIRARHAQAKPEVITHAGCRARAVQMGKNNLRRNHFRRYRGSFHTFGAGLNLRAAHANARDRNVGIVPAGLDDDRFRHTAYVLRHAAQAHHLRLACRSGFAIDQPLHIQLVGMHLQALAHHCLAPPAGQAQKKLRLSIHSHVDGLPRQAVRSNFQLRLPLGQPFDGQRRLSEHLPRRHEGFRRADAGNLGVFHAGSDRDAASRRCLGELDPAGARAVHVQRQITGRLEAERNCVHLHRRHSLPVSGGRSRQLRLAQSHAPDIKTCLAAACWHLDGCWHDGHARRLEFQPDSQPTRWRRFGQLQHALRLRARRYHQAGRQHQRLATHGDAGQTCAQAFGLRAQAAFTILQPGDFKAGAALACRNQQAGGRLQNGAVGVAQRYVQTAGWRGMRRMHRHGIRALHAHRGRCWRDLQRGQVCHFHLERGRAQPGVAGRDDGLAQFQRLYFHVCSRLPFFDRDARGGGCHGRHAAAQIHLDAACRSRLAQRQPDDGDNAGAELERGWLQRQGRLSYLNHSLTDQIGNANQAPDHRAPDRARWNGNGVEGIVFRNNALAHGRSRQINADGRRAVMLQKQVIERGRAAFHNQAAAVGHVNMLKHGARALRAGRQLPLQPVSRRRRGCVRGDGDGLRRRSHSLQRALSDCEAGMSRHAYLRAGLNGERCTVIQRHVAPQDVGRPRRTPGRAGSNRSGDFRCCPRAAQAGSPCQYQQAHEGQGLPQEPLQKRRQWVRRRAQSLAQH